LTFSPISRIVIPMNRHYFDWAASALPDPLTESEPEKNENIPFGNPSSRHAEGRAARDALEDARARCARVLDVEPEQLYWTSGGTEANAIPLHALLPYAKMSTALFSEGEHASVRENFLMITLLNRRICPIPIGKEGRVTPEALEKTLEKCPDAALAAIMAVNNETGAVTDMAALAETVRNRSSSRPLHLHCDMVQTIGKIVFPLSKTDSASISGHKIGAPRGIGLLYLKKPLEAFLRGGGQERGIRPGTENVAGALALAASIERHAAPGIVRVEYEKAAKRFARLIAFLRGHARCVLIPDDRILKDSRFSPYILQMRVKKIPGEVLVRVLDDAGFAISTGSACSSTSWARPVLSAMGVRKDAMLEGIRISQGWATTDDDISALIDALTHIMEVY